MKVRIEFAEPTELGQDVESNYDAVEFTTRHAGTIDDWGDALQDMTRPSIWSQDAILLSAIINSEFHMTADAFWVRDNVEGIRRLRDSLTGLIPPEST